MFEQFDPGYTGVAVKHYYPFFDLRLVNFLVSIPSVPWLVNKNILREAMKGRFPEAIRTWKKIVFEAPQVYTKGIQEMMGLWIGNLLKNTPLLEDYVNTAELSRFLQSEEIDTGKFMGLEKALAVAYWLRSSDIQTKNFNLTPKMIVSQI